MKKQVDKQQEKLSDWIGFNEAVELAGCYPYELVQWVEAGFITKIYHSGRNVYYKPEVLETKKSIISAKSKAQDAKKNN